jgi:hypothetical protein
MTVFYFFFEAVPAPESQNFKESGGAYVNCWVKSASYNTAAITAKETIISEGWQLVGLEDAFIAERKQYLDAPKVLAFFDDESESGQLINFHTWPPDPQEDDSIN